MSSPVRLTGDARLLENICIQTVIPTSARRRNTSTQSWQSWALLQVTRRKMGCRLQSRIRGTLHKSKVTWSPRRLRQAVITIRSTEQNCVSIHVGEMKLGALRLTMWTVRFQSHTFHSEVNLIYHSAQRPTSRKTRKVAAAWPHYRVPGSRQARLCSFSPLTLAHGVIICNTFSPHQPGFCCDFPTSASHLSDQKAFSWSSGHVNSPQH